jgi:hypothetical protein
MTNVEWIPLLEATRLSSNLPECVMGQDIEVPVMLSGVAVP